MPGRGSRVLVLALVLVLAGCAGEPADLPSAASELAGLRCPAPVVPPAIHAAPDAALFADDFSDPTSSRLRPGSGAQTRYAIDNGAYLLAVAAAPRIVWSRLQTSYGAISLRVEATLVSGTSSTASALLFRYQDANNFYIFNVAHNGFYNLELYQQGARIVLIDWTPTDAIRQWPPEQRHAGVGVRNMLRVDLHDEEIGLWVNGVRLEETLDSTFVRGDVALAVHTFATVPAAICFDNLHILDNPE
jgi:hypothetical protein